MIAPYLFLIVIAGLLFTPSDNNLIETREIEHRHIYWYKATPVECGVPSHDGAKYAGCATTYYDGSNRCEIQMPKGASDSTIAHEFKHCFGYDHEAVAKKLLKEREEKKKAKEAEEIRDSLYSNQ